MMVAGWWLTYPSEKNWKIWKSNGMMKFPIKPCSKPSTRLLIFHWSKTLLKPQIFMLKSASLMVFPSMLRVWPNKCFYTKKHMAAIILVGNYKLSLYRFLVVFSSWSGTYLVTWCKITLSPAQQQHWIWHDVAICSPLEFRSPASNSHFHASPQVLAVWWPMVTVLVLQLFRYHESRVTDVTD